VQLFGPLAEFLEAAGLLDEFEFINTIGSRRELTLRQQQQQQQHEMNVPPPHSMHCNIASQTGMRLSPTESHITPCAAADADDAQALLLAKVAAGMRQLCVDSSSTSRLVQLQAWWEFVRSSNMYLRLGGSAAAAARYLQSWPDVFVFEQDPAAVAAAAGVQGVQGQVFSARVGLQAGAIDALMQTPHFNKLLQGYRQALLAAVSDAAGTAAGGGRQGSAEGVDLGQVGSHASKRGLMPDGLIPYKKVGATVALECFQSALHGSWQRALSPC
jgi:hypothetical protein